MSMIDYKNLVHQIQFHAQEACRMASRAAISSANGNTVASTAWQQRQRDELGALEDALSRLSQLAEEGHKHGLS